MRPLGILLLGGAALTLLLGAGRAEDADAKAREVIEKAIEAQGGKEALGKADLWYSRARVTNHTDGAPQAGEAEAYRDLARGRSRIHGERGMMVVDGEKGWVRGPDGKVAEMTAAHLAAMKDSLRGSRAVVQLVPLLEKGTKLAYVGQEQVNGRPVNRLTFRIGESPEITADFDARTNLLVRVAGETPDTTEPDDAKRKSQRWEVFLGDYRNVGGVRRPFRQTNRREGKLAQEIAFAEMALLTKVTDGLFARPEPAGELSAAAREEMKRFEGVWRGTGTIRDGTPLPSNELGRLNLRGDTYVIRVGTEIRSTGTFTLDPTASPKTVEVRPNDGEDKGKVRRGIYEISGNDHRACFGRPDGERPTEFASKSGSGAQLATFRRVIDMGALREELARKVVDQCLRVREGDLVQITGGAPGDAALLESLAVHARRQGAHPLVTYHSGRMVRRYFGDVPAKYDGQKPEFDLKLAEIATAMITVDSQDFDLATASVSPKRLSAQTEARKAVSDTLLKRNVRVVGLGNGLYPTAGRAEALGMTQDQLSDLFWGAVNVDYDALQARGEKVRTALAGAKEIQITHPNGTNLTVKVGKRPAYASAGVITPEKEKRGGPACTVWLPAGEAYLAPVEESAEGRVVIDQVPWMGTEVRGATLVFKGGRMTSMEAKEGEARLKAIYEAAGGEGKDRFSMIDVGFNLKVQVRPGSQMFAWMADGAVTVGLGNNDWAGGANTTSFSLYGQLAGATLLVDGKPLIKDGKLILPEK
jgi:uncharacterized protein (TIGR03067 family)